MRLHISIPGKVKRLSAREIAGAIKSIFQVNLEIMLHILPLDIFMKNKAVKYILRLEMYRELKHDHFGHDLCLSGCHMYAQFFSTSIIDICTLYNVHVNR